MNLDRFYSLRKDFTLIGLTGRAGAGCSAIAKELSNPDFITDTGYTPKEKSLIPEEIKFDTCFNYLSHGDNWTGFKRINYKDVTLLHIIFEAFQKENFSEHVIKVICQNGDKENFKNRFDKIKDSKLFTKLKQWLDKEESGLNIHLKKVDDRLNKWLKDTNDSKFIHFYFKDFTEFSGDFYKMLNDSSITKRSRFNHDVANYLRAYGKCGESKSDINNSHDNIYTVAETINRLVKFWRKENGNKAKVVIDALKNSLELMYFKEKYSGFYMVAVNKDEAERVDYVTNYINSEKHSKELLYLDYHEYKGDDVNDGVFSSPDIENCIQKSDYHIFHSDHNKLCEKDLDKRKQSLQYQLIKLLALINQPGIITPTAIERTMQIAYNAKYNSGCISRQVGAVVTDENFSVKSIGWNDVAKNQMPCKLRDINDLISGEPHEIFSQYEVSGNGTDSKTKIKFNFNELAKKEFDKSNQENLGGRHCSFCFKTFQNAFEREKNQVHTRSLHAEENAMLQISKKGGIGLEGGILFTTASPCELCSKKAFQLGIKKVYFIDPYPGIAMTHTLKNGISEEDNPKLIMFRGAVGRTFHKLYEPFMSYKDELGILTKLKPKAEKPTNEELINSLDVDTDKKEKIKKLLE